MKKIFAKTLSVALATSISACGGGGDGESTTTGTNPSTNTGLNTNTNLQNSPIQPTAVLAARLTQGTPSPDITAPYGIATITFPAKKGATEAKLENVQFYNTNYLNDAVKAAWISGWNGYGQTITVIDDFETSSTKVTLGTFETTRTIPAGNPSPGTYKLELQPVFSNSHGNIVTNIAAGDADGQLSPSVKFNFRLNSVSVITCNASAGYFCGPGWIDWSDISSAGTDYMTGVLSVRRRPGYAKKASVITDQVDLSKYQDPSTTIEFIAGHIDNASNSSSINISAENNIPTSNLTFDQISSIIAKNTILTKPTNAVVVVAAGNSGAPCLSTNLGGCNLLAALVALAPQTKASSIIVGALAGSGINEQIATYSVRAGALADRFIVASGESGESGVFGTSFAAPKVAGAIALVRQKYPNLTAAEAANLLLLTANKDINNDGKPDFTGVSSAYGHGKLDLSKALSPIGSAAIK